MASAAEGYIEAPTGELTISIHNCHNSEIRLRMKEINMATFRLLRVVDLVYAKPRADEIDLRRCRIDWERH